MGVEDRRLISLDGLRGLAASVVVIHHCLLVSPALATAYRDRSNSGEYSWLLYFPGHLPWLGTEAVYVFFILSGFVLTMPFVRSEQHTTWSGYYRRRAVRLYVPIIGATVVAAVIVLLIPRDARPNLSWWFNAHDTQVTLARIIKAAAVIFGGTPINTAFWSLHWEVFFSALIPLYVLAVKWQAGRLWLPLSVALVLITVGSATDVDALVFLPMFAIGAILAGERQYLRRLAANRSTWTSVALLASSLALLGAAWWPAFFVPEWLAIPMAAVGACALVFTFAFDRVAVRIGSSPVPRWLGRVSFSLYLTHEPIIVSVAAWWGGTNLLITAAIGIPASLLAAQMFYRLVELPSLRLSRMLR